MLNISFTASDASGLVAAWLQWRGDLVAELPLNGDIANSTFLTASYTPGESNDYVISVLDTQGNKDFATTSIFPATGLNRAPQPFITVSKPTALLTESVSFDASMSSDADEAFGAVQVEGDLDGDGLYDTNPTTTKTLVHQFTTPGDWLVRARLTDSLAHAPFIRPVTSGETGGSLVSGEARNKSIWNEIGFEVSLSQPDQHL